MKSTISGVLVASTLALSAGAAGTLQVSGAPLPRTKAKSGVDVAFVPTDSGKALLDLIDGKTSVAAVRTSLADAVADAREEAWATHRMIKVPPTIRLHVIAGTDASATGLVTLGEPSREVAQLLAALRNGEVR